MSFQDHNNASISKLEPSERPIDISPLQIEQPVPHKANQAKAPRSTKKKSIKVQGIIEGPKNYPLSYFYGCVAAVVMGLSLVFSADLGERHDGLKAPASLWPGCLLAWVLFHLKEWLFWKCAKTPDPH